jgi:phage terminase small subunit
MGKMTSSVLESLQAYCNHLADMQRAREKMDESWGMDIFQKYQKIYIEANKQQIVLAKEFGFTPLSGLKVPIEKEESEPAFGDLDAARK